MVLAGLVLGRTVMGRHHAEEEPDEDRDEGDEELLEELTQGSRGAREESGTRGRVLRGVGGNQATPDRPDPGLTPYEAVLLAELIAALHREIGALREKDGQVLLLCYFERRTDEEIASALRMTAGAVRPCRRRAEEVLERALRRSGLAPER
jgi:DNA-directed RNA polymerase specialized sigma24 family protein